MYGALVVTLAMLLRLTNCRFITIIIYGMTVTSLYLIFIAAMLEVYCVAAA